MDKVKGSMEAFSSMQITADTARLLSSQLSLATETTNYGRLEKCCSIWICGDDIPKGDRYSISFYGMVNIKNIGNFTVEKENSFLPSARPALRDICTKFRLHSSLCALHLVNHLKDDLLSER